MRQYGHLKSKCNGVKTNGNAIKTVIYFCLRTIFVKHIIQKIIFKYKLHIK